MDHIMHYNANLERRIRERAFQIWIEEGQPLGRDREHWAIAEAEVMSTASPPLAPDQPIGEIAQAQQQASRQGGREHQAPPVAGTNPDDVTR